MFETFFLGLLLQLNIQMCSQYYPVSEFLKLMLVIVCWSIYIYVQKSKFTFIVWSNSYKCSSCHVSLFFFFVLLFFYRCSSFCFVYQYNLYIPRLWVIVLLTQLKILPHIHWTDLRHWRNICSVCNCKTTERKSLSSGCW